MSSNSPARIVRRAIIAAFIGASVGTVAALWWPVRDARNVAPRAQTAAPPPVAVRSSPAAGDEDAGAPTVAPREPGPPPAPSAPISPANVTRPSPAPMTASVITSVPAAPPPAAAAAAPGTVLERARALALRADVRALVALRESVVRSAGEHGGVESAEGKEQLDRLDGYLEEARALRLKLDAEELRKWSAATNRRNDVPAAPPVRRP
jgi:hypothetical protein